MDGMDFCEECEKEHREEVKELREQLKAKEQENKDLREDIKDIADLLDLDTGEEYNFGNIESAIKNYCADCDVAERMRKVTYAATGGRLSYANYTVEAIEQAYNDQLRIDVEYRTKELEEQLNHKEQECERLKDKLNKIEEHLETISYLAPVTTRVLKHSIKTIIEE